MRKTIAAILTIMIMLTLCSCGAAETEPVPAAEPAVTEVPEMKSEYSVPANAEQQRQLIEQMRDSWEYPAVYSPWSYVITDLDRNGRLEVITASTQGSGIFTYAEFWEVNESFDGLNHCTTDRGEGNPWPEIIKDSATCYEDDGKFFYVFEDGTKSGVTEFFTSKEVLCLYNGNVSSTCIAYVYTECSQNGEIIKTEYKDGSGNMITEEEYETAEEKYFTGKAPETVRFDWTEVFEEPDLSGTPLYSGKDVIITKSPTSEAITEGGKTWFIAYADNAESSEWQLINPADGCAYTPEQAMAMNGGLEAEALDMNTLAVSNVPASFNGWQVKAVFSGSGKSAETDAATVYVGDFINAYIQVIQTYTYGGVDSVYTSLDAVLNEGLLDVGNETGIMANWVSGTGYYLKDINKDGIPELFIGSTGSDEYEDFIIDCFTLVDGTPKRLAASSERCVYRLRTDNLISVSGSSGASDTIDMLLKLTPEGLAIETGVSLYGDSGTGGMKYYRMKDTSLTRPNNDEISEAEYNAAAADIHAKDYKFGVTTFTR